MQTLVKDNRDPQSLGERLLFLRATNPKVKMSALADYIEDEADFIDEEQSDNGSLPKLRTMEPAE